MIGRARDCEKWGQMKPRERAGLGPMEVTGDHIGAVLGWWASPGWKVSESGSPEANSETRTQMQGVSLGGTEKTGREVGSDTGKGRQPIMGLSGSFHITAGASSYRECLNTVWALGSRHLWNRGQGIYTPTPIHLQWRAVPRCANSPALPACYE